MKRFILVSILILMVCIVVHLFINNAIGDQSQYSDSGNYYYDLRIARKAAMTWALSVFAALMTVNILYELYIVPKKKKRLENKE